jgi:hypothetical protein
LVLFFFSAWWIFQTVDFYTKTPRKQQRMKTTTEDEEEY